MADAKFGAVHGIDVSASFNNARDTMLSTSAAAGKLIGAKFSAAWAAFAKTGDPNNSEIRAWAPFDAAKRTTMVFDPEIRAVDDYRGDLIRMLATTT